MYLFRIAALLCVLAPAAAAQPAAAALPGTPYQATVIGASCAGNSGPSACVFTFPKVAAGMSLTVTHVSCHVVTAGFSGGVTGLVLYSSQFGANGPADNLSWLPLTNGTNQEAISNLGTTFFVNPGRSPMIQVATTAKIVAVGTTSPECLVSGYTN